MQSKRWLILHSITSIFFLLLFNSRSLIYIYNEYVIFINTTYKYSITENDQVTSSFQCKKVRKKERKHALDQENNFFSSFLGHFLDRDHVFFLIFFFTWSLSWTISCFLVFLLSFVFFYKFPLQMLWSINSIASTRNLICLT